MDADDLAAQVVGVGGRFLRVPWHTTRAFVDRCVATREGIRVVSRGDVEVPLGAEGEGAPGVTALQALRSHLEQNLARAEVERVSLHLKASEHVLGLGP